MKNGWLSLQRSSSTTCFALHRDPLHECSSETLESCAILNQFNHTGRDFLRPLPIVVTLALSCDPTMRVLDIGVGTGSNAIFLARNGFHVDALDGSVTTINELQAYAEARALPVRAMVYDLRRGDPDYRAYKLVVLFPCPSLFNADARQLTTRKRSIQATPGTLHVLGAITAGDFQGTFTRGPFLSTPRRDPRYARPVGDSTGIH
jgi:SAM-dependent methyltransferase